MNKQKSLRDLDLIIAQKILDVLYEFYEGKLHEPFNISFNSLKSMLSSSFGFTNITPGLFYLFEQNLITTVSTGANENDFDVILTELGIDFIDAKKSFL